MEKLIRQIESEVRVISKSEGIVLCKASDATPDAYNEVIRVDGWDYDRNNLPFLDSHKSDSAAHILGRVEACFAEDNAWYNRVKLAVDVPENHLAQVVFKMMLAGYLKAVSVGFFPISFVSPYDPDWKRQLKELGLSESSGVRRIYTKQKQIELSACAIGANPNALLAAHKAGAINERDFELVQKQSKSSGVNIPFPSTPQSTESTTSMRSQIVSAFDRVSGKTKSSIEALHKAQRGDSDSDLQRALHHALPALRNQRRSKFADPYAAILGVPEYRCWLNAIARVLMRQKLSDEHNEILRAMGTDSTPGSTMVTGDLASLIYNCLAINGSWATLGAQTVLSGSGKFSLTTAYPEAYFVAENGQINDDTAFAGESKLFETKAICALVLCSLQLVQDAEEDISRHILENVEQALNYRLDYAVFSGDGVNDANNGETTGLFVDNTIPVSVAGAGNTKLQDCDEEDFLLVLESVDPAALQRGCAWWISATLLPALMRAKDESGKRLLCVPPESDGFYLCGHPVNLVPVAPTENAASKKMMLFGEPQGYAVALRNWFEFGFSSEHKWTTLQRSFRAHGRARGKLRKANAFAILKTAAA
ncbi:MAG: phage major capsid protein [Verrucomicrobiota bacterium]